MARGRRRKIELGYSQVVAFFDNLPHRVYTRAGLQGLLLNTDLRTLVGVSVSTDKLIDFLAARGEMSIEEVSRSTHPNSPLVRYVWREASPFEMGLSLASKSYLTHAAAVQLHSLSDELPRRIYVNREQSPKPSSSRADLTQAGINRAFASKQRETNYICTWRDWQFAILSGKNTGRLEVGNIEVQGIRVAVTKLERTLIDIAVRPTYAGGVYQVLDVYRRAKDRASVGTMLATLKSLEYVYPYHQTVGYYLQRAGYQEGQYERFKALGLEYDFFLAHDLRQVEYVSEWRLFVPKGF